jgi:light-regulated signal transduction histidine kinase (bacteriophytochrome)
MGNLYLGQFLFADEPIDYKVFLAQARQYGFSEEDYFAALESVPRLSRETVNACIRFLAKLSKVISQMSYSSIKLARSKEAVGRVNDQLTASNKELEAFTYSVSHDLRAPLRHINGFSKILSEEFAAHLPEEAQHHVERIEDETRRMGMLVDDLLNLTRIGRSNIVLQVTGLKTVVQEVITSLAPDTADREIEWKIGELPYVECDTALMKQVFQNLLANALKFTRPRKKAIIEIGQIEKDGVVVVYVRDNGVGFSMKYADKLFGVFERLHRSEDFEGTGVGLATVQRILHKHGGRIWAEAELDKGATFYITIGGTGTNELKAKTAVSGATT